MHKRTAELRVGGGVSSPVAGVASKHHFTTYFQHDQHATVRQEEEEEEEEEGYGEESESKEWREGGREGEGEGQRAE